jgi:hypothetical protein
MFTDGDAASVGHQFGMLIGDHLITDPAGVASNDRQHLSQQPSPAKNVCEQPGRQRGFLRRLQNHAVISRNRRRDLVRGLMQRMVERCDDANRGERLAQGMGFPLLALGRQVTCEVLRKIGEARVKTS